jgi:hypothetical protein
MTSLRPLLLLGFLLVAAPAAYAQLDPGTDPLSRTGFVNDCGDTMNADECMASGTTTTRCTDSYGCPQCGMSGDMSTSVCWRVYGNWGYCSCTPNGTYINSYGIKTPSCKTQGSCTSR